MGRASRSTRHGFAGLAVLAASLALAAPAAAATFTVDSTADVVADAPPDGICDTDGGGDNTPCTLREAIREANETGVSDDIDFGPSFNGEAANDTIGLEAALSINQPVSIDGGDCSVNHEPCVGIQAGTGSPAFDALQVLANDVSIRGVAITNARQGIFYSSDRTGLDVSNSWFGLDLDSVTDGNDVAIEAVGNQAGFGSADPADRNVFGGNEVGLHLAGNNHEVQGNWFGVRPDNTGTVANATDILIQSNNTSEAPTGNQIGGTPTPGEAASAVCDGPCNVISGATGAGIDLRQSSGGNRAAHETAIQGNAIGTRVDGSTAAGNATGIAVGEATETTIGGMVLGQGNLIARSAGNGISIDGGTGTTIQNNTLNANLGDAIHLVGDGTDDNVIRGNVGNGNGAGALNPFIDLQPPDGAGNSLNGPNGGIQAPTVVAASTVRAVGVGRPAATVDVYRESSFLQVGEVTALAGTGAVGPAGIWSVAYSGPLQTINVATATQTGSLGTSEHSIPPPGDLFDGSGDSTAPTTGVSARKVTNDRTPTIEFTSNEAESKFICRVDSQRATPCAASFTTGSLTVGQHTVRGQAVDKAANLDATPAAVTFTIDTTKPNTSITSGPAGQTTDRTPTFTLASNEVGARFQCRVDGALFAPCRATTTIPKLDFGAHTFRARALDRAGNVDPTPAQRQFTVVKP